MILSFRCYVVVAIAAVSSGCASQSSPDAPQHTVRQTTETAPADLQLLCANKAAQTFGMAPDSVRPVSSSAQGVVFSVVVAASGSQLICTIDQEGTILSLNRA